MKYKLRYALTNAFEERLLFRLSLLQLWVLSKDPLLGFSFCQGYFRDGELALKFLLHWSRCCVVNVFMP